MQFLCKRKPTEFMLVSYAGQEQLITDQIREKNLLVNQNQRKSVRRGCYLERVIWILRNTVLLIFFVDLVTKRSPKIKNKNKKNQIKSNQFFYFSDFPDKIFFYGMYRSGKRKLISNYYRGTNYLPIISNLLTQACQARLEVIVAGQGIGTPNLGLPNWRS